MKHVAKKRFGQNFLTDQGVINSLVEAIAPQTADLMVENRPRARCLNQTLAAKIKTTACGGS
jgi:16S rRNA (adenine1518-N6/adenine1519-N6)-dimethyltransferase